jgi:hypothetical protein
MELPIEFQNKADQLDYDKSERGAYLFGATDMYKSIDSLLMEDLDLHTKLLKKAEKSSNKAEIEQLKSVISYLQVRIFNLQYVKPL